MAGPKALGLLVHALRHLLRLALPGHLFIDEVPSHFDVVRGSRGDRGTPGDTSLRNFFYA